jgi:hypothetical protein
VRGAVGKRENAVSTASGGDTRDSGSRLRTRARRLARAFACLLLALALVSAPVARVRAQADYTEYQVKAAFLFNFARFVEWPPPATEPPADAPVLICVLGDDPFDKDLEKAVNGKQVRGRNVEIKRATQLSELAACPLIFIGASEERRLEWILGELKGKSVLTVGEFDGFAKRGGMIGFKIESRRVRFDINAQAAEAVGLKLSSQLLKVGDVVTSSPAAPEDAK